MHFLWQHPQIGEKWVQSLKKWIFFPIFSIFTKGIKAKLNYLESESDTLTQNGLENQFPFSITTSALCIGFVNFVVCFDPLGPKLLMRARQLKKRGNKMGFQWWSIDMRLHMRLQIPMSSCRAPLITMSIIFLFFYSIFLRLQIWCPLEGLHSKRPKCPLFF